MKNRYIISLVLLVMIVSFSGCKTTGPKEVASLDTSTAIKKVPVDVDFAATAIMTHLRGAKVPAMVKVKFDPALKSPDKSMAEYRSFVIVGNDLFSYKQVEKQPEFKLADGILHLKDLFGRNAHLHYRAFYKAGQDSITLKRYWLAALSPENPDFRVIAVERDLFLRAPKEAFESWESLYTLASRLDLIRLKANAKDLANKKICVLVFFLDSVNESDRLKLLLAEENNADATFGADLYSKYLRFGDRPVAMVEGPFFSNPKKPLYVKLTIKKGSGLLSRHKVIFNENLKALVAK
jgi:hypothetical protein